MSACDVNEEGATIPPPEYQVSPPTIIPRPFFAYHPPNTEVNFYDRLFENIDVWDSNQCRLYFDEVEHVEPEHVVMKSGNIVKLPRFYRVSFLKELDKWHQFKYKGSWM